jgi:hypothetical protein
VPKIKVIPYVSIYRYTKFGQFWTLGRPLFWISMFERLKILEIRIELGPACQSGPLLNRSLNRPPARHAPSMTICHAHFLTSPLSAAVVHRRNKVVFLLSARSAVALLFKPHRARAPAPRCRRTSSARSSCAAGATPFSSTG